MKPEDDYNDDDRRVAGVLRFVGKHWLFVTVATLLGVTLRSCLHV